MLAAPSGPARGSWNGFALEVKWDGCRGQARVELGAFSLRTRHGRACTSEFPELEELGDAVSARSVILDCELVCLAADGLPDFAAVRARLGRRPRSVTAGAIRSPATLVVFDVLHLDDEAVWGQPYEERRALLNELLEDGPRWQVPRYFVGAECGAVFAATQEQGVEGVIAKRLSSPYSPGRRSRNWVKFKHRRREKSGSPAGASVTASYPSSSWRVRQRVDSGRPARRRSVWIATVARTCWTRCALTSAHVGEQSSGVSRSSR